jgi:hypothetical protein
MNEVLPAPKAACGILHALNPKPGRIYPKGAQRLPPNAGNRRNYSPAEPRRGGPPAGAWRAPGCGRKRIGSGRGAPDLPCSRISAAGHDSFPGLLLGSHRRSAGVARQTRVLPVSARQDPALHPNRPLTLPARRDPTPQPATPAAWMMWHDTTPHACAWMIMLVLSLTSTHTSAAWMILGFPFLILFPALATSNQRYWGISAPKLLASGDLERLYRALNLRRPPFVRPCADHRATAGSARTRH